MRLRLGLHMPSYVLGGLHIQLKTNFLGQLNESVIKQTPSKQCKSLAVKSDWKVGSSQYLSYPRPAKLSGGSEKTKKNRQHRILATVFIS